MTAFKAGAAITTFDESTRVLDAAGEHAVDDEMASRDFALFGSGQAIFFALYSVGFFGVFDPAKNSYTFCHDGSAATLETVEPTRKVAIHPCYWKALDVQTDDSTESLVVQINDEYEEGKWADLSDVRTLRLGTIVEDLSRIEVGLTGHVDFERWVLKAVKILFNRSITNVQLKPNPAATQQRDVVGTIAAGSGLWRRVRDDYGTRQIIFECKNYEEIDPDDFRQVLSYLTGEYGRFAVVVTRAKSELPSPTERAWIRTMYAEHQQRLMLVVPAETLARCIRKLRNPNRLDYAEDVLSKRMDTFVRSYLNMPSAKRFRKKKPKALRRSPGSQGKEQRNAKPVQKQN